MVDSDRLKLTVVIACAVLCASCHYEQRNVDRDSPSGADGAGDSDAVSRAHAVIAAANPVTRLLGIPNAGSFALNGSASYTDDGTPISAYAWTSTGDCLAADDLTLAMFFVDGAAVADACEVTLTVTDAQGLTDSTSAILTKRAVGGYVSPSLPCSPAYDASLASEQGTAASPWCSLAVLVDALAENAIADVLVENVTLSVLQTTTLPAARYHGGYARVSDQWTVDSGVSTLLGETSDPSATLVELTSPGTYLVEDFTLQRGARCESACVTMRVSGASALLDQVTFARIGGAVSPSANPAATSVTALAVTDELGPTRLDAVSLSVASDAAERSTALAIEGAVRAHLTRVNLTPGTGGRYSFGLRAHGAATIVVDGELSNPSMITIADDSATHSTSAYGIALGRSAMIAEDDACASGDLCDGGQSLQLTDVRIVVSDVQYASALTAFGTDEVTMTRGVFRAKGSRVDVIRTAGVGALTATSVTEAVATYAAVSATPRQYARAFVDGVTDAVTGAPRYGAQTLVIDRGDWFAVTPQAMSDDLIAVELLGTVDGRIDNATIRIGTSLVGSTAVVGKRLFALATAGVTDLNVANTVFSGVNKPSGEAIMGAVIDGVPTLPHYGSTRVAMSNCTFDVILDGSEDTTERSCVRFNGTESLTMTEGEARCRTETAPSGQVLYNVAGVHAYDAGVVRLNRLTVRAAHQNNPTPLGTTYVIGVLDGGLPTVSGAHGSRDVMLDGLQIEERIGVAASPVGVWLRESAMTVTAPRILNTRVVVANATGQVTGIVVDRQGALVAYNTVRYGICGGGPCVGSGVGVELIETQSYDVRLFANVFSTQAYASSNAMASVLDVQTASDAYGLRELTYAAFGGDGAGAPSPPLIRAQVRSGTAPVPPPTGAAVTPSELSAAGIETGGSASGAIAYCGASSRVSRTTDLVRNAVPRPLMSDADYESVGVRLESDGDATPRVGPLFDAGANERDCN